MMDRTQQPIHCANCDRGIDEVPLISIATRDGPAHICPQCLPILIHKPYLLAGKLPGVESLQAREY